jgi:hypothetical protein
MRSLWITTGLSTALLISGSGFAFSQSTQNNASQELSNTDRFSLHVEIVRPSAKNYAEVALQVSVTSLTDELLFLTPFRGRTSDPRVFLELQSTQLRQREQLEDGSFPLGRGGAAMVTKPHATTSELESLTHLYSLNDGNYHVYVMMRDPRTQRLIRSNTISFEYSATQAMNAR